MIQSALDFWNAIKGKINQLISELTKNCLRIERYDVSTEPTNGKIGVKQPFGKEIFVPYSDSASNVRVGDTVFVVWWNTMSNARAWYFGNHYGNAEYENITAKKVTSKDVLADKVDADTVQASNVNATSIIGGGIGATYILATSVIADDVDTDNIDATTMKTNTLEATTSVTTESVSATSVSATNVTATNVTATNVSANKLTINSTPTWTLPTAYNSRCTITNGGYATLGNKVEVQMQVTISDTGTDGYMRLYMTGLPRPAHIVALSVARVSNSPDNTHHYNCSINANGELYIGFGLTSETILGITGTYWIN